jgi:deazaflavin-dependent oxidoreductase (nitroreductase family)
MESHVRRALAHGGICDLTTTGRRSGLARRIELVYHVIDGRIYISGMPRPRKRAWLLNLEADPRCTLHLKGTIAADLPAVARPIDDPDKRRRVLEHVARAWRRTDVEAMVTYSPLIEVTLEGLP